LRDEVGNGDLFALLLEQFPVAVALFDTEMHYLGCSRRWLTDYGIAENSIIGRSHYDLFPNIDAAQREIHRQVLAGETRSAAADPFEHRGGKVDWIEWTMSPWYRPSGEIGGAIMVTKVVNDLVKSKQRGLSLDTELSLLADSARHDAVILLDSQGRVAVWNTGAERLYGWAEDEAVGQPYSFLFEHSDRQEYLPDSQLSETKRKGIFRGRSWRVRRDGSRFLADVTISSVIDERGELIGFGKVVRDITQADRRPQEIDANEAHLRSILDTVPDAMITIDGDGLIASFSSAAEQMFGYTSEEVIGRNVAMLMPAAEARHHDGYLARYNPTTERRIIGTSRRVFGQRKDGSIFPHELNIGEAKGGGRRIFTGFLRELTAREEADVRLRELQAELMHMSRVTAVGTLATALAHELNQPLTAIANYMQTSAVLLPVRDGPVLELVTEALEEAGREALRAGAIVQRLRDFVTRGELDRANVTPRELVTQACALAALGENMPSIRCDIAIEDETLMVIVDRIQIQQVILNLVRNACEAMPDFGEIVISAKQGDDMIRISVTDNGPGIERGKEEHMFEPFVSSKANGMGLGLAICRTIIEAHGGHLWCDTPAGGGAAFHFTVPVSEVGND
jgi:two-component system sensor kinase FixL